MFASLHPAVPETLQTGHLPVEWRQLPDRAYLDRAIGNALAAVARNLEYFGDRFPKPSSIGGIYPAMDNTEWTNGFWTGILWLSYELTGSSCFRETADIHIASFDARQRDRIAVSAGYGTFMALFDPAGNCIKRFGTPDQVPVGVEPYFYATFHQLENGNLLVANWQGHGPDNGSKGEQLLEFDAAHQLIGTWSSPDRISSLQGILPV